MRGGTRRAGFVGSGIASGKRKTYRHGNLAAEAVAAAYRIVSGRGAEQLSLRRVADEVGVAHRSLYNHFADREALVGAVAQEGFDRLAAELRKKRSVTSFIASFVEFALANPALYDLMMSRRHATLYQTPELQSAVHGVITEALRVFGDPDQDSTARRRAVMKHFILIHGGITLHRSGILDVGDDAGLVKELTAMVEAGR